MKYLPSNVWWNLNRMNFIRRDWNFGSVIMGTILKDETMNGWFAFDIYWIIFNCYIRASELFYWTVINQKLKGIGYYNIGNFPFIGVVEQFSYVSSFVLTLSWNFFTSSCWYSWGTSCCSSGCHSSIPITLSMDYSNLRKPNFFDQY